MSRIGQKRQPVGELVLQTHGLRSPAARPRCQAARPGPQVPPSACRWRSHDPSPHRRAAAGDPLHHLGRPRAARRPPRRQAPKAPPHRDAPTTTPRRTAANLVRSPLASGGDGASVGAPWIRRPTRPRATLKRRRCPIRGQPGTTTTSRLPAGGARGRRAAAARREAAQADPRAGRPGDLGGRRRRPDAGLLPRPHPLALGLPARGEALLAPPAAASARNAAAR